MKLPLSDFRAVRNKLEPEVFLNPEGLDAPPSDLVEHEVWDGIMHLPEDVSIRISDHNGIRLKLMHQLWCDWIEAIGNPDRPDELFACLLEAADCLQGAIFNLLHGYYRIALSELRTALELAMIGAYANLYPSESAYLQWKAGDAETFGFTRCRKRLFASLKKGQAKWLFDADGPLAAVYRTLCNYTHARPDAGYGVLWQSNGPVYDNEAIRLAFFSTLSVQGLCYLLIRIARPDFVIPEGSEILFELEWMPEHAALVRAYTELFGKAPNPPLSDGNDGN